MVVSPNQKLEDEQRGNRGAGGGTLNRNTGASNGSTEGSVVQTEKLVFTMPKLQVHNNSISMHCNYHCTVAAKLLGYCEVYYKCTNMFVLAPCFCRTMDSSLCNILQLFLLIVCRCVRQPS